MADNDFNFENKDSEEQIANSTEADPFYVPTKAVTSYNFFEQLKVGRNLTITGLVTLGVGTVSFGLTAVNSSINSPKVADTPTQLQEEKNKDELIAQLKEKHSLGTALSSQKQQLEESQENQRTVKKEPAPKSLNNSEIEVEKVKPPQTVEPTPIKTKQAPVIIQERPKPIAVSQPEVVEIKPPPVAPSAPVIPKAPTPPQLRVQSVSQSEKDNPYKKWEQAAQTARISVSTANEAPVEQVSQEPRPEQESKAVLTSYPTTNSEVLAPEPVAPNTQPIEKVRIVKVLTSVKKATPPKRVKPANNHNPVRFWQQAANYGNAVYTPKTPMSKTPQQPKQRAVQVAASYPAEKPRSKVIKKTTNPERAKRLVRLRHRLKNRSLAKSNFKPQKRLQIKTVSAMEEASQPINAEVAKGYGLFLNFRQLAEEVTGVLVGDPTAITFHHNNGFVFIRQIKPINFLGITRSRGGGTQLVVLTNSQYGTKQYVFHLTPVNEKVSYSGIVLKPNQQQLIQPQPTSNFTKTI